MSFHNGRNRGRGSWRGSSFGNKLVSTSSSFPSQRGGFSSRGKTSNWGKPNDQDRPDIVKHPLGQLLKTIAPADLNLEADQVLSTAISSCKYVASYNWMNGTNPTVAIPGRPPQWTPHQKPRKLAQDIGDFLRDPNGARYPQHPTAPSVEAILELNPDYDTSMTDIVACGSTLGHLLRFAHGVDRPFRLALEVVGSTVFLVRKENDPKELLKNVRGYGHTFLDEYTTWDHDVKGSVSHQRLIQYELGGLRCVVRFEVDGYLEENARTDHTNAKSSSSGVDASTTPNALMSALGSTSLHDALPTSGDTLVIKCAGSTVPQASIFDIKTRSRKYRKDIDMSDILPTLWLKQFPNFIVAYHNGDGLFEDIRVHDVRADLRVWEVENQKSLQRFVTLLKSIVQIAKDSGGERLEVYSPSAERLEVRKQHGDDNTRTLPPGLMAQWEGNVSESSDEQETLTQVDNNSEHTETGLYGSDSDDGDLDYTACSVEFCGYCGRCTY